MIYLDNAATSFPKPSCVYNEVSRCMTEYCANPGRGGHAMSIASGKAVLDTREAICSLFNIKNPLQLCFTKNATEALNLAINSVVKPGCHVITTCMEHNSVIRPLMTLQRDIGIELSIIQGDSIGRLDPDMVRKCIKTNTSLIVSTLSSNVNGTIMPIKDIGKIAEESEIVFLLDASQGAGSIRVDINEIKAGLLAFPGHKGLLGPQGTGGLYVSESINIRPIMSGGTGSNSESLYQPDFMPDLLESGTLNTPGIVGLGAGVRYILDTGIKNIENRKKILMRRFFDGIRDINGIINYSSINEDENSGIAALNIKDMDSTEVSFILDKEYAIATRAGLHCAPLAHKTLGTEKLGIIRFSPGFLNTNEQIDYTLNALNNISKKYAI